MIRIALAVALTSLLAATAHAQNVGEFGRASGGQLEMIAKRPRNFSGSLDFSFGDSRRAGATFGGSLVDDRLWFFASTLRTESIGKVNAQPVDWNNVDLSIQQQQPETFGQLELPASTFLSLRSTTMISPSAMMEISVSQKR